MSIRSYNNSLFLINNSENLFKSVIWKDQNSVILSNNKEVLVDKKVGKGLSLDESKKIVIDKPHNMNLKIKIKANQPARSLKYIFQENKIPPWERENYPCVYLEDKLIAVIGLADSVEYAAQMGFDRIEIYTGPFADFLKDEDFVSFNISKDEIAKCIKKARSLNLGINAGHDLNLNNLPHLIESGDVDEVSIGHAIITDALKVGFEDTIIKYIKSVRKN